MQLQDVRTSLTSNDVGVLSRALTTLRNQFTIRSTDPPPPQDERFALAKSWLDASPGARDIFSIMDRSPQQNQNVSSLCLAVLSSVLNLLSAHFIYHPLGEPIVKELLSPTRLRQLNSNLASSRNELILSSLKVFNAMSTYGGCVYQKSVAEGFSWGQKSLHKLLFMRRKGKVTDETDPMSKPDIRTLFIFFILSFLTRSTPTHIKLIILEQHRDVFLSIFKGISRDPYAVARHILELSWDGIWNDAKMKKTLKIGLFNEQTVNHLLKLYARDTTEDGKADSVPADLVHHFLLALTTRPGVGICFKDQGWYPRELVSEDGVVKELNDDGDDEPSGRSGGKIYNKILANIIKGLKVNEDARQLELTLKILEACPELVAGYWNAINLTLEPRLSSRWITNITIVGTIISLPIPKDSFLIPHSEQFNPSPPPLYAVIANVLPSVLSGVHLTKGLQSTSRLVQHCTALLLAKCLAKLSRVLVALQEIARELEEDEDTGQWSKRRRELESELERRVPDFMVIVAMVQQIYHGTSGGKGPVKATLLTESALRLLSLYHQLLPRLTAEVRFDIGKLLLNVVDRVSWEQPSNDDMDTDMEGSSEKRSGMDVLQCLHVIRLLQRNEQFSWSSKPSSSPHSYLYVILHLHAKASHPGIRAATSILVSNLLSSSILFSHDPAELSLWLAALPKTVRYRHATAPDGTDLSDEILGVLAFLDDCIQRCIKTPYRYLEEGISFFSEGSTRDSGIDDDTSLTPSDPSRAPSPLIMTLFEQLRAKSVAALLSPSDTLAIVTFIRKLICRMMCKKTDLHVIRRLQHKFGEICLAEHMAKDVKIVQDAIRRECELLSGSLGFVDNPIILPIVPSDRAVKEFLEQVESLQMASITDATVSAYELIDWMRLIHPPLHPTDVKRLVTTILRLAPFALDDFLDQLDPKRGYFWASIENNFQDLGTQLSFELAYLHAAPAQIAQASIRDFLASLFFQKKAWSQSLEQKLSIIMQKLAATMKRNENEYSATSLHISLLTLILHQSLTRCNGEDIKVLKRFIFSESDAIMELCCSSSLSSSDLREISALVRTGLDPSSLSDRSLAREYCNHWIAHSKALGDVKFSSLASPWFSYMDATDIIRYLDTMISSAHSNHDFSDVDQDTLDCILNSFIQFRANPESLKALRHRLRGLLGIRPLVRQGSCLDALLLKVIESGLPLYYDALPLGETKLKVSDVARSSQERWEVCKVPWSFDFDVTTEFLHTNDLTKTTVKIISAALYQSPISRQSFATWLSQEHPPEGSSLGLISIALHSFLDILSLENQTSMDNLPDAWFCALLQYLIRGQDSLEILQLCASCICTILEYFPSKCAFYLTHLLHEIRVADTRIISLPFLLLLRDLRRIDIIRSSTLLDEFNDVALKWMTSKFSEEAHSNDDLQLFQISTSIISDQPVKVHLLEPVVKLAIQSCFYVPIIIKGVIPLVSSTPLKPATVNRLLQNTIQHSQLYRLTVAALPSREPIIRLLHALFYLHPANTCQPSHIIPLVRLYGGTLSSSDMLLFSIFYLYEKQRKESSASLFRRWKLPSSHPDLSSQDVLGAISSLDPSTVFRTCTKFPTRRCMDATTVDPTVCSDDGTYDPLFLTLLIVQLLAEHKQLSTTTWVQIFRSNVVSAVVCVLTSRDEAFRQVGASTLAGILGRVLHADFIEKEQVIYIMNMLRDLLPSPSGSPVSVPRLPASSTMIIAHALRSTLYPSSFLYPVISRFLLQRPEFDTTDVPLLYSLLYNSEDGGEWMRKRTWMIRFLTDSIREGGRNDWTVLRRRHTWDLLASMWQATRNDEKHLRKGILEFLANISANSHAIPSLLSRSGLLTWIELQLQTRSLQRAEHIAFAKILENITVSVNASKAKHDDFTATLARCINMLIREVNGSGDTHSLALLHLISRIILFMVSRLSPQPKAVSQVLKNSMEALRQCEFSITWTTVARQHLTEPMSLPGPPHYAQDLFDASHTEDQIKIWNEVVRNLWGVMMTLGSYEEVRDCWDGLSCRLLLMHGSGLCYPESVGQDIREWVRKQTMMCLMKSFETRSSC